MGINPDILIPTQTTSQEFTYRENLNSLDGFRGRFDRIPLDESSCMYRFSLADSRSFEFVIEKAGQKEGRPHYKIRMGSFNGTQTALLRVEMRQDRLEIFVTHSRRPLLIHFALDANGNISSPSNLDRPIFFSQAKPVFYFKKLNGTELREGLYEYIALPDGGIYYRFKFFEQQVRHGKTVEFILDNLGDSKRRVRPGSLKFYWESGKPVALPEPELSMKMEGDIGQYELKAAPLTLKFSLAVNGAVQSSESDPVTISNFINLPPQSDILWPLSFGAGSRIRNQVQKKGRGRWERVGDKMKRLVLHVADRCNGNFDSRFDLDFDDSGRIVGLVPNTWRLGDETPEFSHVRWQFATADDLTLFSQRRLHSFEFVPLAEGAVRLFLRFHNGNFDRALARVSYMTLDINPDPATGRFDTEGTTVGPLFYHQDPLHLSESVLPSEVMNQFFIYRYRRKTSRGTEDQTPAFFERIPVSGDTYLYRFRFFSEISVRRLTLEFLVNEAAGDCCLQKRSVSLWETHTGRFLLKNAGGRLRSEKAPGLREFSLESGKLRFNFTLDENGGIHLPTARSRPFFFSLLGSKIRFQREGRSNSGMGRVEEIRLPSLEAEEGTIVILYRFKFYEIQRREIQRRNNKTVELIIETSPSGTRTIRPGSLKVFWADGHRIPLGDPSLTEEARGELTLLTIEARPLKFSFYVSPGGLVKYRKKRVTIGTLRHSASFVNGAPDLEKLRMDSTKNVDLLFEKTYGEPVDEPGEKHDPSFPGQAWVHSVSVSYKGRVLFGDEAHKNLRVVWWEACLRYCREWGMPETLSPEEIKKIEKFANQHVNAAFRERQINRNADPDTEDMELGSRVTLARQNYGDPHDDAESLARKASLRKIIERLSESGKDRDHLLLDILGRIIMQEETIFQATSDLEPPERARVILRMKLLLRGLKKTTHIDFPEQDELLAWYKEYTDVAYVPEFKNGDLLVAFNESPFKETGFGLCVILGLYTFIGMPRDTDGVSLETQNLVDIFTNHLFSSALAFFKNNNEAAAARLAEVLVPLSLVDRLEWEEREETLLQAVKPGTSDLFYQWAPAIAYAPVAEKAPLIRELKKGMLTSTNQIALEMGVETHHLKVNSRAAWAMNDKWRDHYQMNHWLAPLRARPLVGRVLVR